MPDIAMCNNTSCKSHKECVRFMAVPHPSWQSYANFAPEGGDIMCEHFVDVKHSPYKLREQDD
jgi:hypothetical protein